MTVAELDRRMTRKELLWHAADKTLTVEEQQKAANKRKQKQHRKGRL